MVTRIMASATSMRRPSPGTRRRHRSIRPRALSTTAFSFSKPLRTFCGFVDWPTLETGRAHARQAPGRRYVVRRLIFRHTVAPIFGSTWSHPWSRW